MSVLSTFSGRDRIAVCILTSPCPYTHRAQGKPVLPFIIAHVSQVLIMYSCYEASQLFWADYLYGKSVPSGLQFQIFGVVMLWEYFSMIFLRSSLGIRFFPRVTLLYILMFHCKCSLCASLETHTLRRLMPPFSLPTLTQSISMKCPMDGLPNFWLPSFHSLYMP